MRADFIRVAIHARNTERVIKIAVEFLDFKFKKYKFKNKFPKRKISRSIHTFFINFQHKNFFKGEKMKLKLMLASLACVSALSADMIIAPSALPANAQSFIKQHFAGAQIALVEQDGDSFDVKLNDGTEVDFLLSGEWTKVDAKYKPIAANFVPANVLNKVKATQPNAGLIEVERKLGSYKFKFNNNMEVFADTNGNILGQKFDD